MEPAHLLGTGGALGAVLRYAIGQWLVHDRFPFATLLVNVVGSFALGLLTFADLSNEVMLFVGVGMCGSFTTYSSFSFEVVRLWESGNRLQSSSSISNRMARSWASEFPLLTISSRSSSSTCLVSSSV